MEMLHYTPLLLCKGSAKDDQMDHNDALGLVGWPRIVLYTIHNNTIHIVSLVGLAFQRATTDHRLPTTH